MYLTRVSAIECTDSTHLILPPRQYRKVDSLSLKLQGIEQHGSFKDPIPARNTRTLKGKFYRGILQRFVI